MIGVPDSIAGEVPVLVLPDNGSKPFSSIRDSILDNLGPEFVPERILTLNELGLKEVPMTTSGKVQKSKLSSAVRDFMSNEETIPKAISESKIRDQVLTAYSRATSIPVDDLDVNADASRFADSITFMRVRDYLRKKTGHVLTTKEISEHSSIMSQVELLQERAHSQAQQPIAKSTFQGPPSLNELEILVGENGQARELISNVSRTLEGKGFNWSHVSSIIPTHDCMQVLLDSHTIDTWNFAISVRTYTSTVQVRNKSLKSMGKPLLTIWPRISGQRCKQPCHTTLSLPLSLSPITTARLTM